MLSPSMTVGRHPGILTPLSQLSSSLFESRIYISITSVCIVMAFLEWLLPMILFSAVESVWRQTMHVGGVCMEDSAVEPLTPVLYQLE